MEDVREMDGGEGRSCVCVCVCVCECVNLERMKGEEAAAINGGYGRSLGMMDLLLLFSIVHN